MKFFRRNKPVDVFETAASTAESTQRTQASAESQSSTNSVTDRASVRLTRNASSFLHAGGILLDTETSQIMANHLYNALSRKDLLTHAKESQDFVALRSKDITCLPSGSEKKFDRAASIFSALPKCQVIAHLSFDLARMSLAQISPVASVLNINDFQIGVVDNEAEAIKLTQTRSTECAVLLRDSKSILVFSNDATCLISYITKLEAKLAEFLWKPLSPSASSSLTSVGSEKKISTLVSEKQILSPGASSTDLELATPPPRRHIWLWPVMVSAAMLIVSAFAGAYCRHLVYEILTDGGYMRLALLLYIPLLLILASSLTMVIVTGVCMLIGPISHLGTNSQYFSGCRPNKDIPLSHLPEITIQCPVYKESLSKVLDPTFQSVQEAIKVYKAHGGIARLLVNDDALQLLPADEAQQRIKYYKSKDIAWTARPAHKEDGYQREGRFKKGSNMNFALQLSTAVEEKLDQVIRHEEWSDDNEDSAYESCLAQVLRETEGIAWAAGNIRIGELILIIDSDTRVPTNCFLDAALEFAETEDLAILQHSSGVLQVTNNYWENAWAFFTRSIYLHIKYTVAAGDQPPFFGHNAFLKWSAMQEVSFMEDGKIKWWSDKHVSEDFEMSLKLQTHGYSSRLAAYYTADDEFKEGVCLTVYEEIVRWEKYAFGISEIVFNPFRHWFTKGPFTPLFRQLIRTNSIAFYVKFSIISYMGSYYAIGSSWILILVNYFAEGWFQVYLDLAYINSFGIMISVLTIFPLKDGVVNAYARFRKKEAGLFSCLWEHMSYMPLIAIFFSGLSMHVSWALICHLCSIPIQWSFTSKTLDASNFWQELPKIWKHFKWVYAWCVFWLFAIVILAIGVPADWQIRTLFAIFPLAWSLAWHILVPFALNPQSYLSELK